MSHTKSGKIKTGYQRTINDYQSKIDAATKELEGISQAGKDSEIKLSIDSKDINKKTIENYIQEKIDGRHRKEIELVSVNELDKFKEYNRGLLYGVHSPNIGRKGSRGWNELLADIKENGIKEPLILIYGQDNRVAYLGEGNTRLAIAKELGIKDVPVVVIRERKGSEAVGAKVKGYNPDGTGYVPGDLKPSDIGIPTKEITSKDIVLMKLDRYKVKEALQKQETKPMLSITDDSKLSDKERIKQLRQKIKEKIAINKKKLAESKKAGK